MKRHLLILFAALLPLVASAHDFEVDGIYYNITSNTEAEVTYKGNYHLDYEEYSGSVTIPTTVTHDGVQYSVTSIGYSAFFDCSSLTAITIPESVTSIEGNAFYNCSSLTSITIPESVTSIGGCAFDGCSRLTAITIPEGVTRIEDWAFGGCSSLTAITIPEGVTRIGNYAFSGCSSLTSITIPESVTSIGEWAFSYCSLTAITIPEGVTSIGSAAFASCSSLTAIVVAEGNKVYDSRGGCNAIIETSSNTLIQGCSVTIIPESVTSIGGSAFNGCSSLTSITIPESVTSIGNYAFHDCSSLTAITIPEGVTSIGSYAFWNCSSLTSITIPEGVTSIGNYAFGYCSSLTAINIPEGVTSIEYAAFRDCSSLTAITIPEGVTSIGNYAFYDCRSLTAIICNAATPPTIYSYTFDEVDRSIPVYVPAGSVEAYKAAEYWSEFTNIQAYSDNVWVSDNHGQSNSNSSKTFTFEASQGDILSFDWIVSSESGYDWFIATLNGNEVLRESGEVSGSFQHTFNSTETCTLVVQYTKDGSVDGGKDLAMVYNIVYPNSSEDSAIASGTCGDNLTWKLTEEYELVIEGTGDMYDYGQDSAPWYEYCHMINKVALPDGMLSIGNWAFGDCSSLTSITIPESVTNIGEHAFSDCSGLTTLTIPESVTSIESWAFLHCTGLTSITIPANVINIGYGILMGCNGLVSVVVEVGNPVYDSRYNCNAIIETSSNTLVGGCSITVIPDDITSIGNRAFCYCDFATISIPESVTKIEDYAFGRSYLTSITLPESVTSIGREAFAYCENLASITIPGSVTSIGTRAFNACYALTEVHISSIEAWCKISFSDFLSTPLSYARNLYLNGELVTELVIPESVTSIGDYAFLYCHNLAVITCKATTPPAIGGTQTFDEVDNSIPVYVPAGSVEAYKAAEYWSEFTNILPIGEPEPATVTITINQYGSGTYSSEYALDFSEVKVLKAYVATGYNHLTGEVTLLRVHTAEAGTGLLVKGTPGVSYEVPILESTADHTLNMLVATLEKTPVNSQSDDGIYANYKYTVVKEQSPEPLFYKFTDGSNLSAGKAYLQIPMAWLPATGQRALRYRFDEGETTDIDETTDDGGQSTVIYDLMGRRVASPKKGEVYIINNKKVVY